MYLSETVFCAAFSLLSRRVDTEQPRCWDDPTIASPSPPDLSPDFITPSATRAPRCVAPDRLWNCSWLYLAVILQVTFHPPMFLRLSCFPKDFSMLQYRGPWLQTLGWLTLSPDLGVESPPFASTPLPCTSAHPTFESRPSAWRSPPDIQSRRPIVSAAFFRKILVFDSDPIRVVISFCDGPTGRLFTPSL